MSELALKLVKECLETKAPYLELGNCGLFSKDFVDGSALANELSKCTHLKTLILSNRWWHPVKKVFLNSNNKGPQNYINRQPTFLGVLQELKVLIICGDPSRRFDINEITFISQLIQLEWLDASYNQIKNLRGLEELTKLQYLYLSDNVIEDLTHLKDLGGLRLLDLSYNRIKKVVGLDFLREMKELYASHNLIKRIEGLEHLVNLEHLDLRNNELNDLKPLLPFFINRKDSLKFIYSSSYEMDVPQVNIGDNPLISPPVEITKKGIEFVLSYFGAIEQQGADYLYEAKMLIVGQPRAGKTSLRYKLLNTSLRLPTEEKTTRGIDIERLSFDVKDHEGKPRKFYYNIWDFGGQQIYQTTHQFFLTQRSLYILVIDTGNDALGNDDSTINYWLQAVELLGSNSPLLLIKNEKNERTVNIDISQKKARFTFLKNDYSIDLNALIPNTTTFNSRRFWEFSKLKEDIENELRHLPLVGFPMPKNWVQIRNELQKLSLIKPYISLNEFIAICEYHEIKQYERQVELSKVFHDLGIFLHFQNYSALEDFIILQNTWTTDAVFAVLDNINVQKNKGRFSNSDLSNIWQNKRYQTSIHKKLLSLMMQFELCYEVDKTAPSTYIIPEMLPEMPPMGYKWRALNELPLEYRYDFMPKGILTRLIVRLHKHIANHDRVQIVWKTGVRIDGKSLDCPDTFGEITEAWNNRQLNIRVTGAFSRELLSKITFQVDELNFEFFGKQENRLTTKSKWHKMIPCNCLACLKTNQKHFYKYEDLINRRSFGKETIECEKPPFATVNISQLLDGIFIKKEQKTMPNTTISDIDIFVSYSSKDRELREILVDGIKEHLDNKTKVSYRIWADTGIDLGANWRENIEKALKNSDAAILLVSASFAASKFIKENELAEFFKRKAEDGYLILPVLLRNYKFSDFEQLSALNFFKTYYNQYGYNKPTVRNKLMPFDVLGDNDEVTDKQLQDYYCNLADYIHTAVKNHLKK